MSAGNTSSKPLIFRGHVSFQGSNTVKNRKKDKSWENVHRDRPAKPLLGNFPPPYFDARSKSKFGVPIYANVVPVSEVRM